MKETYFRPDNIGSVVSAMIDNIPAEYQRRTPPPVDRAVLLVLDMQRFFLEPGSHAFIPSAPAILSGLNRLIMAFSKTGRPVIYTRHVNSAENAGLMGRWWRDTIGAEGEYSLLCGELNVPPDGPVLRKSQYDAFHNTELEAILVKNKIDTVVIGGVMTHLCCETTARSAFMRGFNVTFLADGTAAYTAAHHRASLLNLAHGFAHIVTVEALLAQLEKR